MPKKKRDKSATKDEAKAATAATAKPEAATAKPEAATAAAAAAAATPQPEAAKIDHAKVETPEPEAVRAAAPPDRSHEAHPEAAVPAKTRTELLAEHREARRRRAAAPLDTPEYHDAADAVGRIEVEIAAVERAMIPPRQ